ncbi:F-box only protein 15 [Kryptolebias marmoratus]|uniref:F-box only protein 15 n=1 Tax=Kryptolebias marmoratus TaxID=37003 RepID=UPI0018ACC3ED|nr:F-box only protein 15 [Kryptolebias marmoratus]
MAVSKADFSCVRARGTFKRADKSTQNYMKRLPSEILMKILSYLDASALVCISITNKLFCQLANDNVLWHKIYITELGQNKTWTRDEPVLKMELQDQAAGYMKQMYFKNLLTRNLKRWKRLLGHISCHTGLPSKTEQVLRNLCVTWELTVTDKSGHESTLELSWSQFCKTSLTLCWSGGVSLPHYEQISTLQLHGVRRIALSCPGLKNPGRRSLMAKLDMQPLTKSAQVIGQDRMVQLKLLQPGILIGVWRDQCSVAFILFTLHFHRLVERSIQGSSDSPYVEEIARAPSDDIDPEYGLHGYQLHIALDSSVSELMSGSFPQLFCHGGNISDGLIQLTAVSRTNSSQHMLLSGNITLPWRCEALQGSVENCCIMSLTLLDEFCKPFKYVSSPISMELEGTPVSCGYYDYDGETYLIYFQDSDIQMKMQLIRFRAERQFILVSLNVYVSVCYVNKHFRRNH